MVKPYHQGDLNGLCGIYAAVHAFRTLTDAEHIRDFDDDLFRTALKTVPSNLFPKAIWAGFTAKQLSDVVGKVSKSLNRRYSVKFDVSRPFLRTRFTHRDDYVAALDAIAGDVPTCFIIWVDWKLGEGGGSHWTVLRGRRDGRLLLIDSSGAKTLDMARLGVSGSKGRRLRPQATIAIQATA